MYSFSTSMVFLLVFFALIDLTSLTIITGLIRLLIFDTTLLVNSVKSVKDFIKKVKNQLHDDKKALEKAKLWALAQLTERMINEDVDERITVKQAKKDFGYITITKI